MVRRHGRAVGRGRSDVHSGQSDVEIRLSAATVRRLRAGQHVDVAIAYGRREPLRVRNAVLRQGVSELAL